MKRRAVLAGLGAFGAVGVAGCSAGDGRRSPGEDLTVPDGSELDRWRGVQYDGDPAPPAPPSDLSADVVRGVAAEAEEAYLYDRLENESGLRNYGVAGYTVDPGAYVADRGPDAVLVRVRMGYSWECGATVADGVSKATYRITTGDVVRVEGTTVDPDCESTTG